MRLTNMLSFAHWVSLYSSLGVVTTDAFLYYLYGLVPEHAPHTPIFETWDFPVWGLECIALIAVLVFVLTFLATETLDGSLRSMVSGLLPLVALPAVFVVMPPSLTLLAVHAAISISVMGMSHLDWTFFREPLPQGRRVEQFELLHDEVLTLLRLLTSLLITSTAGMIIAFVTILWSPRWEGTPYVFSIGQASLVIVGTLYLFIGVGFGGIGRLQPFLRRIREELGELR